MLTVGLQLCVQIGMSTSRSTEKVCFVLSPLPLQVTNPLPLQQARYARNVDILVSVRLSVAAILSQFSSRFR